MREFKSNPSVANPDIKLAGVQYERNPAMDIRPENIKNTAAIANSSASHTYGHTVALVQKYILDMFPADTFKVVTATTSLASRQLRHTPSQIVKMEAPTFVIAPRIAFGQDENRFLAHTIMNSRFTNTFNTWGDGSLLELANDKMNGLIVNGHYNRAVIFFDIVLGFNSFMEQTNWMSYIHNMMPIGHPFFIRAPMELYIPEEFLSLISHLVDIPISDNTGSVQRFTQYMNSVWYHPITYKLKGSSNSDEFFMYYLADIDTIIQEPSASPGNKDGQIKRNFDISFTVRCEFNTVGYFMLNSPRLSKSVHIPVKDDHKIIPLFVDNIDLKDFNLPVGWTILGFPIFKLGLNETSISIDNVLNQSIRTVIDYHLANSIPIERFLTFQFRENGVILDRERFYIDWPNRRLHVSNPNYSRTYRLLISVSHDYVNRMIKELYNLE